MKNAGDSLKKYLNVNIITASCNHTVNKTHVTLESQC